MYSISAPRNCGTPQLLLAMITVSTCRICWMASSRSEAPTPQLAPIARGATGSSANTSINSVGRRPIIVRPAVSNEAVTVYGSPTSIAARAAARISWAADLVSIHATSAPPARRPSISSVNASIAPVDGHRPERLEQLTGGARPTRRPRPAGLLPRRPRRRSRRRARRSRRARSWAPCSFRRYRLQPNVLVRMMSAPASTNAWWSSRTLSGCSTFHISGGSPGPSPIPKKLVPVAPSAKSGRSRASRASSDVRMVQSGYPVGAGRRSGASAEGRSPGRPPRRRETRPPGRW